MLTVGELRDLLEGVSDEVEIVLETIIDGEKSSNSEVDIAVVVNNGMEEWVSISPKEISINGKRVMSVVK